MIARRSLRPEERLRWFFRPLVPLTGLLVLSCFHAVTGETCSSSQQEGSCAADTSKEEATKILVDYTVPADCSVVMAKSNLGGWGMFSLADRSRGRPFIFGDVVIQVPDVIDPTGMSFLIRDYWWEATETGGQFEGQVVSSVLPGVGSLANGAPKNQSNVLPFRPSVDEANVPRTDPGAGAFTHYHNYSFYVFRPIAAGEEVLVNYGDAWMIERDLHIPDISQRARRSVQELRHEGMCLDNLKTGRSKLDHAGRSAIATRYLKEGSVVAPVPMLPIFQKNRSLTTRRIKTQKGEVTVEVKQLLLNYVYGNPKSSLGLFPYGPMVNLINHGTSLDGTANVRIQWCGHPTLKQSEEILNLSLDELKQRNKTLLMEIVATRDILPGEEILLDYGVGWETAWEEHIDRWVEPEGAATYTPSAVMDDVVQGKLRTQEEQDAYPYHDNLFTACFFEYPVDNPLLDGETSSSTRVKTAAWNFTRTVFDWKNLRPCTLIQRDAVRGSRSGGKKNTETFVYKVQLRNRLGLKPSERIPRGTVHIVSGVPRQAIRFMDRLYSTDQHLEQAFRHEIGIPDDVFPSSWQDLVDA